MMCREFLKAYSLIFFKTWVLVSQPMPACDLWGVV